MKPAVLFWFYKDLLVCQNRLRLLRLHNPDAQIFGLYGGYPDRADYFRNGLDAYLDDFYAFEGSQDTAWKWLHGDLVIQEWFRRRGHRLSWDTIFIAQWDMLVFGRLERLFASVRPGEMLLSGLRPLREVRSWWYWTTGENRPRFEYFLTYLEERFGYDDDPLCCQFVVVCMPRSFLAQYATLENPELGFIEYRVPMYAQLFDIPFAETESFECEWQDDPALPSGTSKPPVLSARREEVPSRSVVAEYVRSRGEAIVHPFRKPVPIDLKSARRLVIDTARAWR